MNRLIPFSINASGMISFTPESNSTYFVEPGEYAGIQVFTNGKTNVSLIAQGEVTINGKATFGSHSNLDRHIPENNTIEGFTVKGELFINACGAAVAKNNRAAQLTVKTLGLTDDQSYSSDISLSGNTIDGTLGTAPQEYGIYIVPNVTGYKLTVEDNTIQNVKSHGFTIQGGGDGSAKTTIGEYSISSVTALSEKAKEFVTHILNGGNTFGSQLENCCIFEFYGLPFDSLQ